MTPVDRFRLRWGNTARRLGQSRNAADRRGGVNVQVILAEAHHFAFPTAAVLGRCLEALTADIPFLERTLIRADLYALDRVRELASHPDPTTRGLARQAADDEQALRPLWDRLEELGEDPTPLRPLMPPDPEPAVAPDALGPDPR